MKIKIAYGVCKAGDVKHFGLIKASEKLYIETQDGFIIAKQG